MKPTEKEKGPYRWFLVNGQSFTGTLVEFGSGSNIAKCDDGVTRCFPWTSILYREDLN